MTRKLSMSRPHSTMAYRIHALRHWRIWSTVHSSPDKCKVLCPCSVLGRWQEYCRIHWHCYCFGQFVAWLKLFYWSKMEIYDTRRNHDCSYLQGQHFSSFSDHVLTKHFMLRNWSNPSRLKGFLAYWLILPSPMLEYLGFNSHLWSPDSSFLPMQAWEGAGDGPCSYVPVTHAGDWPGLASQLGSDPTAAKWALLGVNQQDFSKKNWILEWSNNIGTSR